MFEITIAVVPLIGYLIMGRRSGYEMQAVFAAAIMTIYLFVYLYVPPGLEIKHRHAGIFFGFLPAVSFFAILFPSVNSEYSHGLTRFLGWLGLLGTLLALGVFKIFIW